MAKTLVMVNAEEYWLDLFPEYEVYPVRYQTCRWMLRDGKLWVIDTAGGKSIRADSLFWRIGPVRPLPNHRAVLEMVHFAGVPCLNPASVLLRGLERLTMLNELRDIGLPVVPFTALIGAALMNHIQPQLPAVLKVGSYHAGYGKMLISSLEQWQDATDMLAIMEDYFTIEPYIDYARDIRCVGVGEQVWAMARSGSRWKANSGYVDTRLIAAPPELYEYTRRIMAHSGADLLALDILETRDGQYIVLECNDVPGLTGFPDSVTDAIVERMKAKIEAAGNG
jgi:ribosomal protein S6--L-glutamate ligase